jgi:hypothetical protein
MRHHSVPPLHRTLLGERRGAHAKLHLLYLFNGAGILLVDGGWDGLCLGSVAGARSAAPLFISPRRWRRQGGLLFLLSV